MRREWTEQEVNYLKSRYLKQPVIVTAKKLNRTKQSVQKKAAKIGLKHYYTDYLSAKMIAKCFGVDTTVPIRWIEKFGLPAKKVVCEKQTRYLIDSEDFWEWAEKYKDKINWTNFYENSIVPQPEWVREQKLNCKTRNHRKKFTEQDRILMMGMLRKGMSYRQIAEIMERIYDSIKHYCRTIYQ